MAKPILPVFEYIVDQDYIAAYFCVNKNKPVFHCNGKCYLAKKLQEAQNEKKQNLPAINLKDYPIGFVQLLLYDFEGQLAQSTPLPLRLASKPRQNVASIFHPPNC